MWLGFFLLYLRQNIKPYTSYGLGLGLGNPGKAGRGGIVRDSSGRWVKGFSRSIGLARSVMTEFWALRDEFNLANQLGNQNIQVELDAKTIVDLLQSIPVSNKSFPPPPPS